MSNRLKSRPRHPFYLSIACGNPGPHEGRVAPVQAGELIDCSATGVAQCDTRPGWSLLARIPEVNCVADAAGWRTRLQRPRKIKSCTFLSARIDRAAGRNAVIARGLVP